MSKPKWSLANLKKERYFIKLVSLGILKVYKSGKVINVKTGNELGAKPQSNGYCTIGYYDINTNKTIMIRRSRLVWLAFKGPIPKFYQVNHKNGIRSDDRLSNFELTTNAENTQHAFSILKKHGPRGCKNYNSKVSEKEVIKMRKLFNTGRYTKKELGVRFGMSAQAAGDIINRKSYVDI